MNRDLQGLLALPESELRHAFETTPNGETVIALVMELRGRNGTRGEQCANAIFAALKRRSDVTLTMGYPEAVEMIGTWAEVIDTAHKNPDAPVREPNDMRRAVEAVEVATVAKAAKRERSKKV